MHGIISNTDRILVLQADHDMPSLHPGFLTYRDTRVLGFVTPGQFPILMSPCCGWVNRTSAMPCAGSSSRLLS